MQVIIMEQLSSLNIQSNTKLFKVSPLWKEIQTFLFKNHVLWFPMGFLDAGYPQVSGADQVIVPITSN